jgi:hypothetical protein
LARVPRHFEGSVSARAEIISRRGKLAVALVRTAVDTAIAFIRTDGALKSTLRGWLGPEQMYGLEESAAYEAKEVLISV